MPFASDKQRRYLYSQKPEVAKKFAQYHQTGGGIMPLQQPSLRDMINEYRADLKQRHSGVPPMMQETPQINIQPEVAYGDPMAHPGQPMGQDTVPAWLTPGEFVVNKEAMDDPMNAAIVEDINTQGQMVQDQNAIVGQQGLNLGGYVKYYQGGDEVTAAPQQSNTILGGLRDFAGSSAGAAAGQRLALIGAGDLAGAAKVSAADFEKKPSKDQEELENIKEIAAKSGQAIGYLNVAAQKVGGDKDTENEVSALDVARTAGKVSGLFDTGSSLIDQLVGGGTTLALEGDVIDRLVQEKVDIALQQATDDGKITVEQEAAMQNLIGVTTELTTVALAAQGSGPKTDFDFIVAARSITNLKGSPQAIAANFQRLIDDANKTLVAAGQATVPTTQFENPSADVLSDSSVVEDEDTAASTTPVTLGDEAANTTELTFDTTIPGLSGKWAKVEEDVVPAEVVTLGKDNKNITINGADGNIYVLYDESQWDLTASAWYVKEKVDG